MDACFVSWMVNAGVQDNTGVTRVNMFVLEMGWIEGFKIEITDKIFKI